MHQNESEQHTPRSVQRTTLVLGASLKPWKYSHKAVKALRKHGHPVIAIGLMAGYIDDVPVVRELPSEMEIATVTLYIGAGRQSEYYDYLLQLNPGRVIFNPGSENNELAGMLAERGIQVLEDCTFVMLGTGKY